MTNSAVDAHVGKYILEECLSKQLKNKTRVLVTHKIESLRYVDYVYIFKSGEIVAEGCFEDIKKTQYYQEVEELAKREANKQEAEEKEESIGSINSLRKESEISEQEQDEQEEKRKGTSHHKKKESSYHEGEDQKKLLGKLMLDEDRNTGAITFNAWITFLRYFGDFKFFNYQFFSNFPLLTILLIFF